MLSASTGARKNPALEHLHLTLVKPDEPDRPKNYYWLKRYHEEKGHIRSVDSDDEVFVIGRAKGQMTLF
jgi:hypothetical protein